MRPLLLILIVVLIVVIVIKVTQQPEPAQIADDDPRVPTVAGKAGDKRVLRDRPLDGEEPEVPPEFDIQIEVPQGVEGNLIIFNITEQHGYYVESFTVHLFKKETPGQFVELYYDKYLQAKGTLRVEENIVPHEIISNFGGEMGTSEDWEARVVRYGRARVEDPDPLPEIVETP